MCPSSFLCLSLRGNVTLSVSKPADLGYGVPNCASRWMVTGDKGHDVFTQVRALSMEVKPYSCLINIDIMGSKELIYHEIREAKP